MALPALDAFKSLENDLAEVKYAAGLAVGLINRFPSYVKLPDGYVSVTMKREELEQLDFAVYEVHRRAKALNETYQAIDLVEEAAPAKAPTRRGAVAEGIHLIRHIDELGEAEDRLIALQLMVDGMADRNQSSAFSLTVGDIHGLVTGVRDSLCARHEGRAA